MSENPNRSVWFHTYSNVPFNVCGDFVAVMIDNLSNRNASFDWINYEHKTFRIIITTKTIFVKV